MQILSTRVTHEKRCVSNSKHWNEVRDGLMTKPIKQGPRQRGWPDYEVDAINRAYAAGASRAEIRALVKELHAMRPKYFKDTLRAIGIEPSAIIADSPGHGPADLHPA